MIIQTLLEITNEPYIVEGTGIATAAIAGAAGGLIKGIGSLFGRKENEGQHKKLNVLKLPQWLN